jgi:hypothetical protein
VVLRAIRNDRLANLLICRSGQVVQDRPSLVVGLSWAGPIFQSGPDASGAVQRLGSSVGNSRGVTAAVLDRLLFRPDIVRVAMNRESVTCCHRLPLIGVGRCRYCHSSGKSCKGSFSSAAGTTMTAGARRMGGRWAPPRVGERRDGTGAGDAARQISSMAASGTAARSICARPRSMTASGARRSQAISSGTQIPIASWPKRGGPSFACGSTRTHDVRPTRSPRWCATANRRSNRKALMIDSATTLAPSYPVDLMKQFRVR